MILDGVSYYANYTVLSGHINTYRNTLPEVSLLS